VKSRPVTNPPDQPQAATHRREAATLGAHGEGLP
jgi:hypothetical protein